MEEAMTLFAFICGAIAAWVIRGEVAKRDHLAWRREFGDLKWTAILPYLDKDGKLKAIKP